MSLFGSIFIYVFLFSISGISNINLTIIFIVDIFAIYFQLKCFQPFFVSLNLPYSIVRGENFDLQILVFNYNNEVISVCIVFSAASDMILENWYAEVQNTISLHLLAHFLNFYTLQTSDLYDHLIHFKFSKPAFL